MLKRFLKEILPEAVIDKMIYIKGGFGASPFYPYNDKLKCIFIHIPKTAGTSIKRALFEGVKRDHIKLKYFEAYDKAKYEAYFKFAIVRNPFDRLVSSYFYIKSVNDGYSKRLELYPDFTSFVEGICDESIREEIFRIPHFMPQSDFLMNKKGSIGVDFLGRFENLESDYNFIINRLGIDAQLEHHNRTVHQSYQGYYNETTLSIVKDIYRNDFVLLGY